MDVRQPQPAELSLEALSGACDGRVVGDASTLVSSISEDSRTIEPGGLFVARSGQRVDGAAFVSRALSAGASAVLCDQRSGIEQQPRIEVPDVRKAWGVCAHELYGRPGDAFSTIGITGTNGKTTVACLVEQALRALGQSVSRLGTLGFFLNGEKVEDSLTTPQPDQMARCFAKVRDAGGQALVLEVSSHALEQRRVAGIRFNVAAFTNLTQDHLDYHGSMEAYGAAKARLLRDGDPGHRVLSVDDPFGERLAQEFPQALTVSAGGTRASIWAASADFGRHGMEAVIVDGDNTLTLASPLLGRHNLENLLVSWGIVRSLGHAPEAIAGALSQATGVAGRLERCDGTEDDVVVVVDYAHTPNALERALLALGDLSFERVICVFGCGGDRDKKKRPLMGRAAVDNADRVIVTSDNPRTEDPEAIIDDITPGFEDSPVQVIRQVDRRLAIEQAVIEAPPGAVVLIAGKGHEDYQLVGDQVLDFDDRLEARRALGLRRARGGN